MADENEGEASSELKSRAPAVDDLRDLCRELNSRGARYIVIGGFAIINAGYARTTGDIDLLIDTTGDNESSVLDAVATLPDRAARQIQPGEIAKWNVVRVADEIVVDLMRSACSIDYQKAKSMVEIKDVGGVKIPFATPELLWLTKKPTHREKDFDDLIYLRDLFLAQGKSPPN